VPVAELESVAEPESVAESVPVAELGSVAEPESVAELAVVAEPVAEPEWVAELVPVAELGSVAGLESVSVGVAAASAWTLPAGSVVAASVEVAGDDPEVEVEVEVASPLVGVEGPASVDVAVDVEPVAADCSERAGAAGRYPYVVGAAAGASAGGAPSTGAAGASCCFGAGVPWIGVGTPTVSSTTGAFANGSAACRAGVAAGASSE
jgi:hypothetical protein